MATSEAPVRDVEQQQGTDDEFIHYDHLGHGSTPAAWALSLIIILGGVIAGVGFIGRDYSDAWWAAIWIGAALVPIGVVVGVVMKKMGYGVEMDSDAVLKRGEDPQAHRGPATPDNTQGGAEKREPGAGTH